MPYTPLAITLPEIAELETRSITTFDEGAPTVQHLFSESFCDEPGCDCRRVFIHVFSDERGVAQPRATLSYGWEDEQFYRDWASFPLTDMELHDLKGPAVAMMQQQSEDAPKLLESFRLLLEDRDYAERIERHYALFRARVEEAELERQARDEQRAAMRKWRPSGKKKTKRRSR